jgi:hypothetical protein
MLCSVGLAYYFYLKSERLEREVRQLRQAAGLAAPSPADEIRTVVIPEGVPAEDTGETSAPALAATPPAAVAAAHAAVAPQPSPAPPPAAGSPAVASPPPRSAGGERSGAAPARGEGAGAESAGSGAAEGAPARATPAATREPGRPSRIGSIYDIPKSNGNH